MQNGGGSTCFACAEDVALMGNPHPASKTRKRARLAREKTRKRVLKESPRARENRDSTEAGKNGSSGGDDN